MNVRVLYKYSVPHTPTTPAVCVGASSTWTSFCALPKAPWLSPRPFLALPQHKLTNQGDVPPKSCREKADYIVANESCIICQNNLPPLHDLLLILF